MKIKICGVRNIESAQTAIKAGADFIGFNFVPTSKRRIEPSAAAEILRHLQLRSTRVVGIFQNQGLDEILAVLEVMPLDYVQLHGDESSTFCASVPVPVIKALSVESAFDPERVLAIMHAFPSVSFFLLDRSIQGKGERLNIGSVETLSRHVQLLIAGGITLDNVHEYVHIPKLYGIDIAGGIETNGQPDSHKIDAMVNAVHVDSELKT
ncbi:MAG TPA: phosphoribosylanthranilate isomerase [Candidatus Paceibacterota bacterium]